MYKQGNKFFSDWRGPDGRRRRKSFPTQGLALSYEADQKHKTKATKNSVAIAPSGTRARASSANSRQKRHTPVATRSPQSQRALRKKLAKRVSAALARSKS